MTLNPKVLLLGAALALVAVQSSGCDDDKPRIGGLCDDQTDCPSGQICLDGVCAIACGQDEDCPSGQLCVSEVCVDTCEERANCPEGRGGRWACWQGRCDPQPPPTQANAGLPRTVDPGEVVILDALENSVVVEPELASYTWEHLGSEPPGAVVDLGLAGKDDSVLGAPRVQFVAPSVIATTTLGFRLRIEGADGVDSEAVVEITVRGVGDPPQASISGAPTDPVAAGTTITLSAAESTGGVPGEPLTFTWSALAVGGPDGAFDVPVQDASAAGDFSVITLVAPSSAIPLQLRVTVTVSDGARSDDAEVIFWVLSTPECDPLECDDGNPCTAHDCDDAGGCITELLDGVPCDDGDPCTTGDECVNGQCTGTPVECEAPGPCYASACGPEGECESTTRAFGAACGGPAGLCDGEGGCVLPTSDALDIESAGEWMIAVTGALAGFTWSDGELWAFGEVGFGGAEEEMTAAGNGELDPTSVPGVWVEGGRGLLFPVWPAVSLEGDLEPPEPVASAVISALGATTLDPWGGVFGLEFGWGQWYFDESLGSWLDAAWPPRRLLPAPPTADGGSRVIVLTSTPYLGSLAYCTQQTGEGLWWVCQDSWASPPVWFEHVHVFDWPEAGGLVPPGAAIGLGVDVEVEFEDFVPTFEVGQGAVIWTTEAVEFGEWTGDAPKGCDPSESPCDGVEGWAGLHAVSPDDIWTQASDGRLLHFDGDGWVELGLGGAQGLADAKLIGLGLTVGHGAVWVALRAEGAALDCPESGDGGCALASTADPARSLLVARYEPQSGTWLTTRQLASKTCTSDAEGKCDAWLAYTSLNQLEATSGALLGAGALPWIGEAPGEVGTTPAMMQRPTLFGWRWQSPAPVPK